METISRSSQYLNGPAALLKIQNGLLKFYHLLGLSYPIQKFRLLVLKKEEFSNIHFLGWS